jgi:hypothetical protein
LVLCRVARPTRKTKFRRHVIFFFFDVLPKQGIQFNQHADLGEKKNILSFKIKKKGKISIFLFVEKGFYERIIGEIIALPHAK